MCTNSPKICTNFPEIEFWTISDLWHTPPSPGLYGDTHIDTEYDWAKVPAHNGNDPPPAPGSLKALLFPPLLRKVQNKGAQGVQARYGTELPPFISIVRYPGRPVILSMDNISAAKHIMNLQSSLNLCKMRPPTLPKASGTGSLHTTCQGPEKCLFARPCRDFLDKPWETLFQTAIVAEKVTYL